MHIGKCVGYRNVKHIQEEIKMRKIIFVLVVSLLFVTLNTGLVLAGTCEPSVLAGELLLYFDAAVDEGALHGTGPGKSARGRLKALGNMLSSGESLTVEDDFEGAIEQYWDAYNRVDGEAGPPEFAAGEASPGLAAMIEMLISCLMAVGESSPPWAMSTGGTGGDAVYAIQQTSDGGYIATGHTDPTIGSSNKSDVLILKLDPAGSVSWQKRYGGAGDDEVSSIRHTSDGGYIVAAITTSSGAGGADAWLLKLDVGGNVTWQKTYGGAANEWATSIEQTSDGGYIVAAFTFSFGTRGNFWVLKLDAGGNVTWQKAYGGAGEDVPRSIQQTSDGGYIVSGRTGSFGAGGADIWVLKLDAGGNVTWQKAYGGAGNDSAYSIRQTSDGGYVAAGWTSSFGTDGDAWVLKLDAGGNLTYQKTYGGDALEGATSIEQTSDWGFIVGGWTNSFGAGGADFWILKLDYDGTLGCGFGYDSFAFVADSTVTGTGTTAAISTPTATIRNTTVNGQDVTATVQYQCNYN
jgi:hypothetical protein